MEKSEKLFVRHIQSAMRWICSEVEKMPNDDSMMCLCYDVRSNAFRCAANENLESNEILVERVVRSEISNEPYSSKKILAAQKKIANLI